LIFDPNEAETADPAAAGLISQPKLLPDLQILQPST
jgi:hypothetical protein